MRGEAKILGAIAQMGERLICIQEVGGSIPPGSTIIGVPVAINYKVYCLMSVVWLTRNADCLDVKPDL